MLVYKALSTVCLERLEAIGLPLFENLRGKNIGDFQPFCLTRGYTYTLRHCRIATENLISFCLHFHYEIRGVVKYPPVFFFTLPQHLFSLFPPPDIPGNTKEILLSIQHEKNTVHFNRNNLSVLMPVKRLKK